MPVDPDLRPSRAVAQFPDLLVHLVPYLGAQLDGDSEYIDTVVDVRIPNPLPDAPMVVLTRTGGVRRNQVTEAAQLSIDCWEAGEHRAMQLAQRVRALVHGCVNRLPGAHVSRVEEFSGPYSNPDPLTGRVRYSFTLAIHVRGTTAHP